VCPYHHRGRKIEQQVKVLVKNLAQQAVSADIIPNSDVGTYSPITEGIKTKAARVLTDKLVTTQIYKAYKF
jgi:hypothetical protein